MTGREMVLKRVKLRAVLALIVLAEGEHTHEAEELSLVVGTLAASACYARVDSTVVKSVRGENRRISDIGEEEERNNYRITFYPVTLRLEDSVRTTAVLQVDRDAVPSNILILTKFTKFQTWLIVRRKDFCFWIRGRLQQLQPYFLFPKRRRQTIVLQRGRGLQSGRNIGDSQFC